jgi:hypothetical protein
LNVCEDLELLLKLASVAFINGILSPLLKVSVPHRAVIGCDRGDAAEDIVRPVATRQRSKETLPHRIVATTVGGPVYRDEQAFHRAAKTVIPSRDQGVHQRGEVALGACRMGGHVCRCHTIYVECSPALAADRVAEPAVATAPELRLA